MTFNCNYTNNLVDYCFCAFNSFYHLYPVNVFFFFSFHSVVYVEVCDACVSPHDCIAHIAVRSICIIRSHLLRLGKFHPMTDGTNEKNNKLFKFGAMYQFFFSIEIIRFVLLR